jgi:hypothetical protein
MIARNTLMMLSVPYGLTTLINRPSNSGLVHINALEPAKIINELLILRAKVEAIRTGHSGLASIRPFEINLDCLPIVSIHGFG